MYPLLYLYVTSVTTNSTVLTKKQWLHFIPFGIAIIDLLPFYLLPLDEKRTIVSALIHNFSNTYLVDSGFLPPWFHYLIKQIQSFIYIIILWVVLLKNNIFKKSIDPESPLYSQINEVKNWLIAMSSWMSFSYIAFVTIMVFTLLNPDHQITGIYAEIASLIFAFSIFALCLHVFFHPNVLYGLVSEAEEKTARKFNNTLESISKNNKLLLNTEEWALIEAEIITKEYYKKKGMSIDRLAIELNISSRQLSFCINYYKKMKFQDYINAFRLKYVISEFENDSVKTNTIEAIGSNAGFGSRSAFFSVFKKQIGCTPLEFIKQKNTEEN
jgi:AraC-like DNA-binding protein